MAVDELTAFLSEHPGIRCVLPSASEFSEYSTVFTQPANTSPSAVLRPTTVQDVAEAVSFLAAHGIDFTVRAGGHDMWGRGIKDGTVALDLRLLNQVRLDQETSTARIGGGTLQGDVVTTLQQDGYMTPVGTIATVGYVGWAMYGGYGPYCPVFGLGVDQIVGAKVVTAAGEVVDADGELLKAIKGAGGAFGVVVEVTVKTYKLNQIFAGTIMYNSDDLGSTIQQFSRGYERLKAEEGIPPQLSLQPAIIKAPSPTLVVLFVWASADTQAGRGWLDKISSLAPVVATTVQPTTPTAWLAGAAQFAPASTRGGVYTINLKSITDEVAAVMVRYALSIPRDPHTFWGVHELRGGTVSAQSKADAVFAAREGHLMFEILAIAESEENLDEVLAWGRNFQRALLATERKNIVPASYLSFMRREEVDRGKAFEKEDLVLLRRVKERVDPQNVFCNAISYI
ncbi:FAD-binding domain-containing protein [Aspergillus indologenus CBS 114.80]|uniref:FAD-binding domain-containing protein n=1 Tax=Aspergillus indologenus CBS 114.80 TaxID=1450541 RepID=A0A2V5HYM6_9EURO|nr:FAD-binding domain-containing protein [Aspergillus indologenus CBS 114.80]